jgi:mono/diheme cytochrome c family protein
MDTSTSAILGLVFLGLGMASVFLMYKLWGYPFDKATRTSAAPKPLMLLHRAIGYAYAALYVFMMWHMVPRLWNYQVELPPRTVAHLMLGITIGVLLLIKISILRFFRHFEEAMPYLGSALLLCTFLLIGLSVPFTLREHFLRKGAHVGGDVFGAENLQRVGKLLQTAGLPAEAAIDKLATRRKLSEGRQVLLSKCVQCHDLRTILMRPRTPGDWVQTVERMAIKPILGAPIFEEEQWTVSAYLIAITPDLQNSAREQRKRQLEVTQAQAAVQAAFQAVQPAAAPEISYNAQAAQELFENVCSQCHPLSTVSDAPPISEEETRDLIARMIENGLYIDEAEIEIVARYLNETYVNPR